MPTISLTGGAWSDAGIIFDDMIVDNRNSSPLFVSTDSVSTASLTIDMAIKLSSGEKFTIPKNNYARFFSPSTRPVNYIWNVTTVPVATGGVIEDVASIEEDEALTPIDCTVAFAGNNLRYSIVIAADVDNTVEIDEYTGIITGSFGTDGVYTITVTATNAAGNDDDAFTVTVVDPA